MIEQIELDTKSLEVMNQPNNNSQILLTQAFADLEQIQEIISKDLIGAKLTTKQPQTKSEIPAETQYSQKTNEQKNLRSQSQATLIKTQDQIKTSGQKKVQTTNLIPVEGKKPRLANDYNKQLKIKQGGINNGIVDQLEQKCRELFIKLSQTQAHLVEEQKLRSRQASDSLKELQILKETLRDRQQENLELIGDIKRILLTKNELNNQLILKDYQIQNASLMTQSLPHAQTTKNSPRAPKTASGKPTPIASKAKVVDEGLTKLEGLVKVNNFVRKKELEAREQSDLIKHKFDKVEKEKLSLTLENRKMAEQIRYLQQLLRNQREQFRRGVVGGDPIVGEDEVPEDEIIKLLIQIDELNQRNSELEYLLQQALKTNLEKDKLFRGTEDVVTEINQKIETIVHAIEVNIPLAKRTKELSKSLPKLPQFTGPETVYDRLNTLCIYIGVWQQEVFSQVEGIQKQKEILESMKPSNQTLTQAEHQAKLEKYLGIYSARIQTLSSIITSYQRHFKSLEEQIRELQGMPNINAMNQLPTQKQIETARIESLKRMLSLKDILIKHQQNEIELVKKSMIADRFNDNLLYYVSAEEKQAILNMRQFDMQVKVVQDFERAMLLMKDPEQGTKSNKKVDEYVYIKQVNEKLQQDLLNVREVFKTDWKENKINVRLNEQGQPLNKTQTLNGEVNSKEDLLLKELNVQQDKKEYIQKWLLMVKDLIQSQFDAEKCRVYLEIFQQEVPLILSIMSNQRNSQPVSKTQDVSLEVFYLKEKVTELQSEVNKANKEKENIQDKCNFIRSKNQQLTEQNILLKKFLHSKKHMADEFKRFFKKDLIEENQYLRSTIMNLTPYNDKIALEVGVLKQQVKDLNLKLIKQDERHLVEQELFQNLEQALLDTQKKLIEKDSEVVRLIKAQKETIFGGKSDQVLDLLITTADNLNLETVKLREQNWQLGQSLKQKRMQLEAKTAKIKQSKVVLKEFENQIKDLLVDNEKLKVLNQGQPGSDLARALDTMVQEKDSINKDKLIYELGKDGASTVVKFLEDISHFKAEVSRMATELQQLKVQNTTLQLLVQDKTQKLHEAENAEKLVRKENLKLTERVEKLEFMYNKVNDDYLAQQQSLDVYITLSASSIGRDQTKAFSRCVDNAKVLAYMVQDLQRQRNEYYESTIYYERQSHLSKERFKVLVHETDQIREFNNLLSQKSYSCDLSQQIMNGIIGRYEKQMGLIGQIVQQSAQGIEVIGSLSMAQIEKDQDVRQSKKDGLSPIKKSKKEFSVIDSPPMKSKMKKPLDQTGSQEEKSLQPQRLGIQSMLNSQLEINKVKSNHIVQATKLKLLSTQGIKDRAMLAFLQQQNSLDLNSLNFYTAQCFTYTYESMNLRLQNIYVSRLCLYSHRLNTVAFTRNNLEGQEETITLMSQELDKLKIENRLLQERNETVEQKLYKQTMNETKIVNQDSIMKGMLERELQLQNEWNTQLEQEILTKSAQINALSKLNIDFTAQNSMTIPINSDQDSYKTSAAKVALDKNTIQGQVQTDDMLLSNLRNEYAKLEQKNQSLHEKIYILENKNSQKDQKLNLYLQRTRELEKQLLQFNDRILIGNDKSDGKVQTQTKPEKLELGLITSSEKEIQLNQDLDDVWTKMRELNDLKNHLYDRNDGLRVEIEAFKTHFSRYEAQELKKRIQGQDSFQFHLYNELTLLREERDLLVWQQNKLQARLIEYQSELEVVKSHIPALETQIQQFEQREEASFIEVQRMKEQLLQATISASQGGSTQRDYDSIRTLLQLYEGGRLRRDKLHQIFENARLRRENDSLRKELQSSTKLKTLVLDREFTLKKKIVELKNELVKLRVTYDMTEYKDLVNQGIPQKGKLPQVPADSKVKTYVDDLTVLRENLLKIEFRNIELEELYQKKDQDYEDLKSQLRDQQKLIDSYQNKEPMMDTTEKQIDYHSQQLVDMQQKLMEEKWETQKLTSRIKSLEIENKELRQVQEKHLEEVYEHQKLHSKIGILESKVKDLEKPSQQLGAFQGDMVFYDSQREKYLSYLSLYIDDIRHKNKALALSQEQNRVLQDQVIRLSLQIEAFSHERDQYKLLIEKIVHEKVNEVESEFATTAQHEEGITKMELLVTNQRKKIALLQTQMQEVKNEKDILEQNIKALNEVVKNLEKHSMEYNAELTDAKDECVKLKGDRERYEQKVAFLWERLDFQQRLHHKVVTSNSTLEQVINVYKEEINKLKAYLHLNTKSNSKKTISGEGISIDTTKSHVIFLENEVSRLKVIEGKQDEHIKKIIQDNDDLRLQIRLADLIRQAVGIQAQERDSLTQKLQLKRSKVKDLKMRLGKQDQEKEKLQIRIEFLEKQIVELRQENPVTIGFVKAPLNDEEQDLMITKHKPGFITNDKKDQMIKDLEGENQDLRARLQEIQRAQYEGTQSSIGSKRQVRAITPVRIRDMQIKTNTSTNLSQRLNSLRGGQEGQGAEFYYGQGTNLDPLAQLRDDISEAIQVRQQQLTSKQGMKLPMIGNQYQTNQDIQPGQVTHTSFLNEKRNFTPLPQRMKATSYSTLEPAENKPPKPILEGKVRHPSVNRNTKQMSSALNMSTHEPDRDQTMQSVNTLNKGQGPQLTHQGSFTSQNNFVFKQV